MFQQMNQRVPKVNKSVTSSPFYPPLNVTPISPKCEIQLKPNQLIRLFKSDHFCLLIPQVRILTVIRQNPLPDVVTVLVGKKLFEDVAMLLDRPWPQEYDFPLHTPESWKQICDYFHIVKAEEALRNWIGISNRFIEQWLIKNPHSDVEYEMDIEEFSGGIEYSSTNLANPGLFLQKEDRIERLDESTKDQFDYTEASNSNAILDSATISIDDKVELLAYDVKKPKKKAPAKPKAEKPAKSPKTKKAE